MIPLSPEEHAKLEKELKEMKFPGRMKWGDLKNIIGGKQDLVMEGLRAACSDPLIGEAFFGGPIETKTILDYTGLRGSGSNLYYSFVYQLPKWHFTVKKVTEAIAVTPTFADYYNITIAQKQKLEASIRQGLASAMQAVTDYELLSHDKRRYQEILDYFVMAKKGKDDHILRYLFVDRVDAFTGEGFSLVSMAKRWPTIITDFVRLKSEWFDTEKVPVDQQIPEIMKRLDVSQAEATVLRSKNILFMEWVRLLEPSIKDRFSRLASLSDARKASIDEYRNWLKPYLSTFKSMKEINEDNLSFFRSNPYIAAGFGQSQSFASMLLWCWRPFTPPEMGKPPLESTGRKGIRGKFMIDPYDDFVRRWQKVIEYKYNMKFEEKEEVKVKKNKKTKKDVVTKTGKKTPVEIESILQAALQSGPGKMEGGQTAFRENPVMVPYTLYYAFLDVYLELNLSKTPPPQGVELDNLMFAPIRAFYMSQNILLLHLMEVHALEEQLKHEINRMIGSKEVEEAYQKQVEKMFDEEEEKKKGGWQETKASISTGLRRVGRPVRRFATSSYFLRKGPYEPTFYERGSKMYARAVGPAYGLAVEFIKSKMHVG